jgi:hypothetical protein
MMRVGYKVAFKADQQYIGRVTFVRGELCYVIWDKFTSEVPYKTSELVILERL